MRKRLPAYGRELQDTLRAGREPYHGLAVWLDGAAPAHGLCARLGVFPDTDPADLDWSLCRGRDVFIPYADEIEHARLMAACRAIRDAGPRRLILLKQEAPGYEFVVSAGRAQP